MEKAVKQSSGHWKQSPLDLGKYIIEVAFGDIYARIGCPYRSVK